MFYPPPAPTLPGMGEAVVGSRARRPGGAEQASSGFGDASVQSCTSGLIHWQAVFPAVAWGLLVPHVVLRHGSCDFKVHWEFDRDAVETSKARVVSVRVGFHDQRTGNSKFDNFSSLYY
eukprot:1961042-Rhodomonas_salina.1